jgi:hypothetical protein
VKTAASGAAGLEPYEAIMAHAERELELAGRGDVETLTLLGAEWEELVARAPQPPSAAAASLLARATLIHERTRIELLRLRDALLLDLDTTRRARRTAEGYAGNAPQRPRLDRSA